MQNSSNTKEMIMQSLEKNGPSLPVHLAKDAGTNILFAGAFLSELIANRKIKTSHMKVGGSPIYLISGQEPQLEKYSDYLKSKEKDAFILLRERKILKDSELHPAIRVALREIKDFAIPFKKNDEIFWRYFTENSDNAPQENNTEIKIEQKEEPIVEKNIEEIKEEKAESKKIEPKKEKPVKKKVAKKKSATSKANEKFFNLVKEFLEEQNIEITGIEGFSKSDLTLKIKENGEEKLLIAHNKKRLTENDFVKANQKAEELEIKYAIMSKGELTKKTQNLIDAIKNLSDMKILK